MKELTREIRNRELVSQGLTPLTEAEWNKISNDFRLMAMAISLVIDAYRRVNGRG